MIEAAAQPAERGTVVLVHGLWLHGVAFFALRRRLSARGFSVQTFSYPSVRRGLDANSLALSQHVAQTRGRAIALVGHSLGGLIVLDMLARAPDPRVRRVVLMGSPCVGSHCAAALLRLPVLAGIVGRSIPDAVCRHDWPIPVGTEVGVLNGSRSVGLGRIVPGLPQPNDGTVAVAETQLAGSRDTITLPVSHTEMLFSRSCARQVAAFVANGSFIHA
jgi:pimeloyl-ACP methyl ester carboxylesterase